MVLKKSRSDITRGLWRNKAWREKVQAILRKQRGTLAYKKRQSIILKAQAASPEGRAQRLKMAKDPEYLRRLSLGIRKAYKEGRRFPCGGLVTGPSKLERMIAKLLADDNVDFVSEWKVPGTFYRVDFYVDDKNLIVEVDGHQSHYKDSIRMKKDERRRRKIRSLGYRQLHLRYKSLHRGVKYCRKLIRNAMGGK